VIVVAGPVRTLEASKPVDSARAWIGLATLARQAIRHLQLNDSGMVASRPARWS